VGDSPEGRQQRILSVDLVSEPELGKGTRKPNSLPGLFFFIKSTFVPYSSQATISMLLLSISAHCSIFITDERESVMHMHARFFSETLPPRKACGAS